MTEQTIPVVNLQDFDNPGRRDDFVAETGDAVRNFGFVAVEGHGVPRELIYENYRLYEALFALPLEVKQRYEFPEQGRQRGYTSFGIEHARDSDKPDLKEFWHLGREVDGDYEGPIPHNVWPAEVAELRDRSLELFAAMEAAANKMLSAISIFLGRGPEFLPDLARGGNSVIRVIHYPVCEGFDEPGVMRAAQHEDINLVTLLPEATESGLELLTADGTWLPIPSLPGQIIVDTGDMMQRLTNDYIPARTHRVVNPQSTPTDRYSMPFFCHPHPDASLAVLAECVPDGSEPKYAPTTANEYLMERLRENGVA